MLTLNHNLSFTYSHMHTYADNLLKPTPSVEGICYGPHAMHCGVWGERAQEIVYSGLHRLDRKVQITVCERAKLKNRKRQGEEERDQKRDTQR